MCLIHGRYGRHITKVMVAIVSFGLTLSSCITLLTSPTPFETAYKTYMTTSYTMHESWVKCDYKKLAINRDNFYKASDNLMNVAKETKPYASHAFINALNDAINHYDIRAKASIDDYDKMVSASVNAYKGVLIDDREYLSALETYFKTLEIFKNTPPVPDKDDAYTNILAAYAAKKEAIRNLLNHAAGGKLQERTGYYYDYDYGYYYYYNCYDSYLRDAFNLTNKICTAAFKANYIAFEKDVKRAAEVFGAAKSDK